MTTAPRTDELAFSVDLESLDATLLDEVTLSEVGIKERSDLQRWIESYPEIVERDLLLVTTEFDQWQLRERRVADRLDVLFLDSRGSLLVAELKRDEAADTTELQALKYAAYCSQLTLPDVTDLYARQHDVDSDEARQALVAHAETLSNRELGPVRVRLVAGGFGPSVTTTVLFLADLGLDIGCVEITARRHGESSAILSSRRLLPPPAAEDYLVKRRRREQEEEERERPSRHRNSVIVLNEKNAIEVDAEIRLNPAALSDEQRALLVEKVAESPGFDRAEWTGKSAKEALRWKYDEGLYSASGLTWNVLHSLTGHDPGAIAGPDYWLAPSGKSLYEEARAVETVSSDAA